jgi:cell division protein FtsI/penicillin-binding protein 2
VSFLHFRKPGPLAEWAASVMPSLSAHCAAPHLCEDYSPRITEEVAAPWSRPAVARRECGVNDAPLSRLGGMGRRWPGELACRRMPGGAIYLLPLLIILMPGYAAAEENLQALLETSMRHRQGTVLISNPATGEILAAWNLRVALDRTFSPGSTAKLVSATAALEDGVISPEDRILCRRVPRSLGEPFHCAHPPASEPFPLTSALAYSCNYFFAELSVRLTPAALARWYGAFGFGQPLDCLGTQHAAGLVRIGASEEAKARATVGEGSILVSPAQLLLAYSAIATGGPVYRFWQRSSKPVGAPHLSHRVRLQPKTLGILRAGFKQCVESGTCQGAAVPGVEVAGKTGTATAHGGSHAWFVGYAPADKPEVALVVFLERGTGGADAAPLAGQILKEYFTRKGARR